MVHRLEFERKTMIEEVRKGQVLRITTNDSLLEFCGFVTAVRQNTIRLAVLSGPFRRESRNFKTSSITSLTEIFSCPLFCNLKRTISGTEEDLV